MSRELGRLVKHSKHELIISEVGATDMKQTWTHAPVDGICAEDASKAVQLEL
jgi:hypothetical protein